jgi:DNA-binding NarL/FixJ family response regulator
MSSRGLPPDSFSLKAVLSYIEQLVDKLGLERFVLFAAAGPGIVATAYAVKHPERVEALILASCGPAMTSFAPAMIFELAAQDWDLFLATLAGGGEELTRERKKQHVEELKQMVTREDWLNIAANWLQGEPWMPSIEALATFDVPTLVIHPRDFALLRFEESQKLAAMIPGARLVMVDGHTSIGEIDQTLNAIEQFLATLPPRQVPSAELARRTSAQSSGLSSRESEVLRLVAAGRSNQQIADELVISQNTVIRHVSNIYAKIGAANRAEATAYAAKHGLI